MNKRIDTLKSFLKQNSFNYEVLYLEKLANNIVLYHGTSDALNVSIGDALLPPKETEVQTEPRMQRRGRVFLTSNKNAAHTYARRAVRKWGGNPIIIIADPIGEVKQMTKSISAFGPIFLCDKAIIIDIEYIDYSQSTQSDPLP